MLRKPHGPAGQNYTDLARDFRDGGRQSLIAHRVSEQLKADEASAKLRDIDAKSQPTDEDIGSIGKLQVEQMTHEDEVKRIDAALDMGVMVKEEHHRVLAMQRIMGIANSVKDGSAFSNFKQAQDAGKFPNAEQVMGAGGDRIEVEQRDGGGLSLRITQNPYDIMRAAIRSDDAGTGAETLLTPEHSMSLIWRIKAFGGWENVVEMMNVSHGRERVFAAIDNTSQKAEIITQARASTFPSDAAAPDQVDVTMKPYLFATKPLRINREVERDIEVADIGIYERAMVERIGRGESEKIVLGNGTNEPLGLVESATNVQFSDTVAANQGGPLTTEIPYKYLVQFMEGLEPGYEMANGGSAQWLISHGTKFKFIGLTDDQGRPLWLPAMAGVVPASLLGKPFKVVHELKKPAAGVKGVAMYGNFKYFGVTSVNSVEVALWRDSNYGALYQIAYQAFHACDARPIGGFASTSNKNVSEAYRVLQMKA